MARTEAGDRLHSPMWGVTDATITSTRLIVGRRTQAPARCASGICQRVAARWLTVASCLTTSGILIFVLSLAVFYLEMLAEQPARFREPFHIIVQSLNLDSGKHPLSSRRVTSQGLQHFRSHENADRII